MMVILSNPGRQQISNRLNTVYNALTPEIVPIFQSHISWQLVKAFWLSKEARIHLKLWHDLLD